MREACEARDWIEFVQPHPCAFFSCFWSSKRMAHETWTSSIFAVSVDLRMLACVELTMGIPRMLLSCRCRRCKTGVSRGLAALIYSSPVRLVIIAS